MTHFVSASCRGEMCRCGRAAAHKVGEEIPGDDPQMGRHNFTAYVCCACFRSLFGEAVFCPPMTAMRPCETADATAGRPPAELHAAVLAAERRVEALKAELRAERRRLLGLYAEMRAGTKDVGEGRA